MIAELGHYALVLAFGLALVQSVLPLWGAARRDPTLIGVAVPGGLRAVRLSSRSPSAR